MLEQFYIPITNVLLKIISAFAVFLIALIVGKFAGMIVTNTLHEIKIEELLETVGVKFFISRAAGSSVSVIIYLAGFVLALNQLGITKFVIIILAVFFALLLVMALLLGAVDAARNFLIGLGIRNKYLSKKAIAFSSVKGKVVEVGYTQIKVLTKENDVLVVPFSALD